jgi:DNA-binding LacI/PurR family transcriptional regulator
MLEIRLSVPPEFMVLGDHTIEGGMKALRTLTTRPQRPTAVLCSNDTTAIGILRQASDSGIAVPQELSVIGFDDIPLAQFATPPLTTVQMSQVELATLAFDALLDAAKAGEKIPPNREHVLTTHLVLRSTTMLTPREEAM